MLYRFQITNSREHGDKRHFFPLPALPQNSRINGKGPVKAVHTGGSSPDGGGILLPTLSLPEEGC